MRKWVFLLFALNFLIILVSVVTIPEVEKRGLGVDGMLNLLYQVLMGFALVLLSYWVWKDGEKLET